MMDDSARSSASRGRVVRGIGEIALRVNRLDEMQTFYCDVIGLELMKRFDSAAFFRIADGVAGHTQILALFDRRNVAGETTESQSGYMAPDIRASTVDHLAFGIALADFDSELSRLRSLGLQVTTAEHGWVGWRSLYVKDPEGNLVELVCFDKSIQA